jgi:uncharacterized membrane protein YqhA
MSGDLERKLIGLVVKVLSVVFLGQIVTWDGQGDLLGSGSRSAPSSPA